MLADVTGFVGLTFGVEVVAVVARGLMFVTGTLGFWAGLTAVTGLTIVGLGLVTGLIIGFEATVGLVFVSMVGTWATLIGLVLAGLVVGLVLLEVTGLTAGLVLLEVAGFVTTAWVGFLVLAGISGLLGLVMLFGVVTTGALVTVLLAGLNNLPPLSSKNITAAITAAINNAMSRSTQLRLRNSMKRSKTG